MKVQFSNSRIVLQQTSRYPFEGNVLFEVLKASAPTEVTLQLAAPSFTSNQKLTINGRSVPFKTENGFIVFKARLTQGTKINLLFDLDTRVEHMVNTKYPRPHFYTISYGPLLLGHAGKEEVSFDKKPQLVRLSDNDWLVARKDIHLSPVYQLLNPEVRSETGYAKQILFKIGNDIEP